MKKYSKYIGNIFLYGGVFALLSYTSSLLAGWGFGSQAKFTHQAPSDNGLIVPIVHAEDGGGGDSGGGGGADCGGDSGGDCGGDGGG